MEMLVQRYRILVFVQLCILAIGHFSDVGSEDDFGSFVQKFNKQYEDELEWQYRFSVWNQNRQTIEKHNTEADAGRHSYKMGMNQFGDMTLTEFRSTMLKYKQGTANKFNLYNYHGIATLPDTVDWRAKGYVTEIGNQGPCGSCWAFTATGALEGQHKKKSGKLVDLSEQNLMDCSSKQGNHGCEGGMMDWSFKYVKENGGIDTEQSYPYNETQPGSYECRYRRSKRGATCKGYVDLPAGNETILNEAVAQIGPIACAVDAQHQGKVYRYPRYFSKITAFGCRHRMTEFAYDQNSTEDEMCHMKWLEQNYRFMFYKNGVYDDPKCNPKQIEHSLVITGYGVENGKEFWDCKNSWGTTWGNQGYIKMVRNKNNQCGIATEASYPTV